MSGPWTRQPGKALVTLGFFSGGFLLLPWVLVSYLFPSRRPNRHWTYRQAVSRTLVRYGAEYVVAIEFTLPPNLLAGKEEDQFVLVPPAKPEIYRDILRCDSTIQPGNVGAVWYAKVLSRKGEHCPGQRVFLHFHAGAYIYGGARPMHVGFGCGLLLKHSPPGTAVFCPEYRLAVHPGGRFPAALQDAVSCYAHLVLDLGIPPQDIVLSGASAGGNLVLALLRYINANPDLLPEPAGLLLWSPWTDLSVEMEVAEKRPAWRVDVIPQQCPLWSMRVFLPAPEIGIAKHNPYISPVNKAIPTRVPIWAQWGSAEVLADDVRHFVRTQELCAKDVQGMTTFGFEVPHATHDVFHVGGPLLGWEKELEDSVKDAMRFLDGGHVEPKDDLDVRRD